LLASLGRDKAVWIGHDWGSPVVWNIASHHPDKTVGVASLCVPYLSAGFAPETIIPWVDREVYPEDSYPAGQWDYMLFYRESFDKACKGFEANVGNAVKALFRKGDPAAVGKPARTASVRKGGGFFGGGAGPDMPRDGDVITEVDLAAYTAALTRNGFFGPDSWYMNGLANMAYAALAPNAGKLAMPVLFLHGEYDAVCETVRSRLAEPMRSDFTTTSVRSAQSLRIGSADCVCELLRCRKQATVSAGSDKPSRRWPRCFRRRLAMLACDQTNLNDTAPMGP
ncbi:MAG: alpha/beta hydrolase, partial [Betaproteobacteria bacterium]|nr:alpha/beta hydrolase [Betaproteobacteria bacterium]